MRLNELTRKLTEKGVKARSEVGTANDVGMEIIRLAESNGVDLIVIATHGMTGWHRLAFGSAAEKVVLWLRAPCWYCGRRRPRSQRVLLRRAPLQCPTRC